MRTDGDRYAEYDVRVYDDGEQDATATGLQRALHAELCRDRPHGDSPWPACWRAEQVVRKWERNVAEAAQEALGGVPAAAPEPYPGMAQFDAVWMDATAQGHGGETPS